MDKRRNYVVTTTKKRYSFYGTLISSNNFYHFVTSEGEELMVPINDTEIIIRK